MQGETLLPLRLARALVASSGAVSHTVVVSSESGRSARGDAVAFSGPATHSPGRAFLLTQAQRR